MKISSQLPEALPGFGRPLVGEPDASLSFSAVMAQKGGTATSQQAYGFGEVGLLGSDTRAAAATAARRIDGSAPHQVSEAVQAGPEALAPAMSADGRVTPASATSPMLAAQAHQAIPNPPAAPRLTVSATATRASPERPVSGVTPVVSGPGPAGRLVIADHPQLACRTPAKPTRPPVHPSWNLLVGRPSEDGKIAIALRQVGLIEPEARRAIEAVLAEQGLSLGDFVVNGEPSPDVQKPEKVTHGDRPR